MESLGLLPFALTPIFLFARCVGSPVRHHGTPGLPGGRAGVSISAWECWGGGSVMALGEGMDGRYTHSQRAVPRLQGTNRVHIVGLTT